jgi:hypothetical protein
LLWSQESTGINEVSTSPDGSELAILAKPSYEIGSIGDPDFTTMTITFSSPERAAFVRVLTCKDTGGITAIHNSFFEYPFGKSSEELMQGDRYISGRATSAAWLNGFCDPLLGYGDGTIRLWNRSCPDEEPRVLTTLNYSIDKLDGVNDCLIAYHDRHVTVLDTSMRKLNEFHSSENFAPWSATYIRGVGLLMRGLAGESAVTVWDSLGKLKFKVSMAMSTADVAFPIFNGITLVAGLSNRWEVWHAEFAS